MKTALYARCSIKSQQNSIGTQCDIGWEKAKQLGIVIDEFYIDAAVTARKSEIKDRPELVRLIDDIRKKKIGKLLVYKRDRLARNVIQYMFIIGEFKANDVEVIFTSNNELPIQSSPAGEFFELVMAGISQREAEQIALRIKETKNTNAKEGKHTGGRIPLGYTTDKEKKLIPDPSKAKIVEQVYTELLQTTCSTFSEFCSDLNNKRIFVDKHWDYNRLMSLIENPIYKGIRHVELLGTRIETRNNLQIVPEWMWNKAQEQLDVLIRRRNSQASKIQSNLDGLLLCGKCRTILTAKRSKSQDGISSNYYSCKNHGYHKYTIDELEERIMDICIHDVLKNFDANLYVLFETVYDFEKKAVVQSINETVQEIQRIEKELLVLSDLWIENPTEEIQNKMLELYKRLNFERTHVMKMFQDKLARIEQYPKLVEQYKPSVPLEEQIYKIKEEWDTLFSDLIESVQIWGNSYLRINLKYPFSEKGVTYGISPR